MTKHLLGCAVTVAAVVALCGVAAAEPPFATDEFQVNSYTSGYQYAPAIAGAGGGSFVVVWQSYPQLGESFGSNIFGQRFDSNGSPLGGEFQANTPVEGYQYSRPDVGMAPDGAFAVVWMNGAGDGDGTSITGRRFDAAGEPLGAEFQANSETSGGQRSPRVAVDANGNVTVAWWTQPSAALPNPDGDDSGIFARRFGADGDPLGGDFQVNEITTGAQSSPDLNYDDNGNLVIVWQSDHTGKSDVVLRRFSAAGAPLAGDFVVSNPLTNEDPRVGVAGNGDFVVVWHNSDEGLDGLDGSSFGVFAQSFKANGTSAGPVFQVNTYTTEFQLLPSIARSADGNFVVAWESYGQSSTYTDIIAQRYTRSAAPFENEFKVDAFDEQPQNLPQVGWIGDDRFAVVWESTEQDGDRQGIFGRIIAGGFPATTTTTTAVSTTTTLAVSTTTTIAVTTTTTGPTTTTLPVPGACGDPAPPKGSVTAGDALIVLRAAVSLTSCDLCVCDVNDSTTITAADALVILRFAVDQPVTLACPACE